MTRAKCRQCDGRGGAMGKKPYTLQRLDPPASADELRALREADGAPAEERIAGVADVFAFKYGGEAWQYRDDASDSIVYCWVSRKRNLLGADWALEYFEHESPIVRRALHHIKELRAGDLARAKRMLGIPFAEDAEIDAVFYSGFMAEERDKALRLIASTEKAQKDDASQDALSVLSRALGEIRARP